jgi:hypothetical protein
VWVWFVAIGTIGIGKLLFEISIDVARDAGYLDVLAEQGIFGFGVVEIESGKQVFPAACGVAGFATLFEFTLVGIDVAGGAGGKFHVLVAGRTAWSVGLMAFFAGDFRVEAG